MSREGEVTYEIRADDSFLDADLDAAEKKVKKSTEQVAQESEKVEEKTASAKKDIKEDVTEHHQEQNQKQEESDEQSHKKREESAKKHGGALKGIASGTTKAIGAAFMAVGTATVAVGTMAVNGANELDKAAKQYIASTGKSVEETERYKKVLESVYANNYGENFEDIANAMEQVDKQLGDLSDEQLQLVTESAFALRDVFEYDVAESTRAAKAMMDNFGISGEEAMNLIAAGAQNGLDYSGELIDSISEYSVQFAKVGLDADDMFKIFQQGSETGAWNLDKIGDAVKEMAIRVVDGSETTQKGFEGIGLKAGDMAEKFAAGGESAKSAFQETVAALAAMEDPLEQNAAGVALFGTMWEDLGPDVVTQLANIGDAAYATGEELNSIKEVKYDDLGSMLEGLKRSVEVLLIPLGEQLIPVLSELIEDVLPLIQEALPPILDLMMEAIDSLLPVVEEILPVLFSLFEELMPVFQQILEQILPVLIVLFNQFIPILGELVSEFLPIIIELFCELIEPLMELIEILLPPLVELFNALMPVLEMLISLLTPIIQLFVDLLAPILGIITEAIGPLIEIISVLLESSLKPLQETILLLGEIFSVILNDMFEQAGDIFDSLKKIFHGLIDFVTGIFSGDWEKAWQGIVDIFDGLISGISAIFKIPLNWIIDGINGFLGGLNGIKIPDWVPGIGGKSFSIPLIPRLKKGMDFVPKDYFPAYLDYGERVLTQQENMIYTALGGIEGMQDLKRNVNVTVENQSEGIDYDRLAEANARAMENVAVNIDGKRAGRIMTPTVNNEIGKLNERRT